MIAKEFEEQVKKSPGCTAIKAGEGYLTYGELNRYANRVARLILKTLKNDEKPGRVSLLFDHGIDMIAAILGVLKAGKTYIPLSTDYPDNRLSYMVTNSESSLVLSLCEHEDRAHRIVQTADIRCLPVDRDLEWSAEAEENPEMEITGSDLAYIMYTSGSTGQPKGVMQTHENVLYYIENWTRVFSITNSDRLTLFSSFCHDGSVQDMLGALLNGATLYPVNVRDRQDSFELSEFLIRERITIWHSVHSLFAYFANSLSGTENFKALSRILLGGEPIRAHEIKLFKKFFPHAVLANVYGQTESSVNSIGLIRHRDSIEHMTIGEPLDRTRVLVLDENYTEVDEFEVGEIIIACAHLSPGYWKDDISSQNTFKGSEELGPLYFTGDLGRLLPDGQIEFMGRKDSQVKLRGFRIELGEIETQLLKHPQVHEAVVTARKIDITGSAGQGEGSGDTYLCAYIVVKSGAQRVQPLDTSALKVFLSEELPDYMIPTYFSYLDRLPLTQSGKIDRRALPEPETGAKERYEAPRNLMEEKLVNIWHTVLGVEKEKIGIDSDFFELGGHSLRGTTMLSKVHREFNVQIPVAELFRLSTVRALADHIRKAVSDKYIPIEKCAEKGYYDLSPMQKRLLLLNEIEGIQTAYNLKCILQVEGELDCRLLEKVFGQLIDRHESLRTSFEWMEDEPVQRIHDPGDIEFNFEYYGAGKRQEAIDNIIESFIRPFDPGKAPLIRAGLIRTGVESHILMIDIHHIVFDGTSMMIILREFAALYALEKLPPLPIQYKDFSEWLNSEKKRTSIKAQEVYWLRQFAGEIPVLEIPCDYSRPAVQSFAGNSLDFSLSSKETEVLQELAGKEGATMYMLLLSVLNLLLAKLSGQEDIVVGTGIAGRNHVEVQDTVGIFVNTLAMRNYPRSEKRFSDFLHEVKERTLQAFSNREYQFEDLIDQVDITRDVSRNPLFDVMFVFQNMEFTGIEIPGLQITPYKYERHTTIFDLNVQAYEANGELKFVIDYCTELFKEKTIRRFIYYFKRILLFLNRNFDEKLSEIEIISPEEKRQLLIDFNDTKTGYPREKTIGQLFEEQATRTPDRVAVLGPQSSGLSMHLSFNRLRKEAGRIGNCLRDKGVSADSITGLLVERSVDMITGLVGILHSGGAYLAIDPEYPPERIEYMLRESCAPLLLTTRSLRKKVNKLQDENIEAFENLHFETIFIDDVDRSVGAGLAPGSNSRTPAPATSLAYVIYTSGSTGKPKGVALSHRNVVNFIKGMTGRIDFSPGKTILAVTTVCFDIFVLEILLPLVSGLKFVIADEMEQKMPVDLSRLIVNNGIDMLQFTPSRLSLLLSIDEELECLRGVADLMIGGEAFPVRLFRVLKEKYKGNIYNMYGPTETAVWSTVKDLTTAETINIGGPIANTQVYILDKVGSIQPVGVPGELGIGGDGLARGYLNNSEMTSEKFPAVHSRKSIAGTLNGTLQPAVPGHHSSFIIHHSARLYKTGDLARWLPDGNIEFIGRIDHQVKLRGFRIEPGEIENRLLEHEKIKEAVVIFGQDKNDDTYLCAYIVGAQPPGTSSGGAHTGERQAVPDDLDSSELREFISRTLPGYMIPAYFVQIEKIPLTPNGKIDRKALPLPEIQPGSEYATPTEPEEIKLAALWAEVLNVEQSSIGIDDNFFELGGHSLKGAVLAAKVHRDLNVRISLEKIFKFPTIRKLARHIKEAAEDKYADIEPGEEKSVYPLSFNQKRLWFIQQRDPQSSAFNMSDTIELAHEVDRDALKKTLAELIRRHGSLRTGFRLVDDEPVQFILHRLKEIPYWEADITDVREREKETEWARLFREESRQLFDLSRVPLCRFLLVKLRENNYRLIYTKHHIISDGWSMQLFNDDFNYFYPGFRTGESPQPRPLRLQYKDFSEWHNRQVADNALSGESYRFWKKKLTQDFPLLTLPRDISGDSCDVSGVMYRFLIPGTLLGKLKRVGESYSTTLFMVMFSTYIIALSRYSDQREIACSIISAGREQESLHPVIGFFVNSLLFKTRLDKEESYARFLSQVHEEVLECMNHQNYPLEPVFEDLKKRYPDIPVAFNLINIPAAAGTGRHFRGKNEVVAGSNPGRMEIKSYTPYHMDGTRDVKFDLEPYIVEYKNGIDTLWAYKKSLFEARTIQSFVEDYVKLLDFFSSHPQKSYVDFKTARKKRKFSRSRRSRNAK